MGGWGFGGGQSGQRQSESDLATGGEHRGPEADHGLMRGLPSRMSGPRRNEVQWIGRQTSDGVELSGGRLDVRPGRLPKIVSSSAWTLRSPRQ